jgi:hypothetical protein
MCRTGAFLLVLSLALTANADFVLTSNQFLEVTDSHDDGILHDQSIANVVEGGFITRAHTNGTSQLNVSSGRVDKVDAYDDSHIEVLDMADVFRIDLNDRSSAIIAGGDVLHLNTAGSNDATITGGNVNNVSLRGTGKLVVTGGWLGGVTTHDTSKMFVLGGRVREGLVTSGNSQTEILDVDVPHLDCHAQGQLNIYGGNIESLFADRDATITLFGLDFRGSGELELIGNEVVGKGVLSGRWLGGDSPWILQVSKNPSTATIRVQELVVGDSNHDQTFNQLDIVRVLQGGKYMTGQYAFWGEGDWNLDGYVDQMDIVTALQEGDYLGGASEVRLIPEPGTIVLLMVGLLAMTGRLRSFK